jgi:nucleotide-binding universal stress UspA family protein
MTVLIPIDYSDYSMRACEIGFEYAHRNNAKVVFLHAYYTSNIYSSLAYLGIKQEHRLDKESAAATLARAETEMQRLKEFIDDKIVGGELPDVKYDCILREGLPEDEINACANEQQPQLIVMGTRGKSRKNLDLIGSVTAEIIERTKAPLLTIPENVTFNSLKYAKHLAFAVSFNKHDLVAFERLTQLVKGYSPEIHLFNISTSHDEWNEIRLTGTREYLQKLYPDMKIDFTVLADMDLLLAIEKFVQEKQIDLISLTTYRQSTITRIFNPGIARKMLFHTNTALLVVPTGRS